MQVRIRPPCNRPLLRSEQRACVRGAHHERVGDLAALVAVQELVHHGPAVLTNCEEDLCPWTNLCTSLEPLPWTATCSLHNISKRCPRQWVCVRSDHPTLRHRMVPVLS